jgi:hypothetical protein
VLFLTGRDKTKLEIIANQLKELNCKVGFMAGDVTKEEDVNSIFEVAMSFLGVKNYLQTYY